MSQGAGPPGAIGQDLVNVIHVGDQFGAFGARRGEVIPVILEQGFLEVAVPQPAGTQAVLVILGGRRRRHEVQQLDGEVLVRVRLGLLRRAAVHLDGHDLFRSAFSSPKISIVLP